MKINMNGYGQIVPVRARHREPKATIRATITNPVQFIFVCGYIVFSASVVQLMSLSTDFVTTELTRIVRPSQQEGCGINTVQYKLHLLRFLLHAYPA